MILFVSLVSKIVALKLCFEYVKTLYHILLIHYYCIPFVSRIFTKRVLEVGVRGDAGSGFRGLLRAQLRIPRVK